MAKNKSKLPSGIVIISFLLFLGLIGGIIKIFVNLKAYDIFTLFFDLLTLFVIVLALIGFKKRNPILYKLTILFFFFYVLYSLYILIGNMLEFENILYVIEDSSTVLFYFIVSYYLILRRKFFIKPGYHFNTKDKSYKKQELFFKVTLAVILLISLIVSFINR
ncbi:MAG: hypothetical protein AABX63_06000 [Nanoarchaeota archaeon]|mgnify:CR=1 FL=1